MNLKDRINKTETYYRIETLDRDTGEIEGGFMAVVNAALALILDMRPDEIDTVDLIGILNKSNPKAYELFRLSLELTKGLPIPEIYKINPDNYICLYRKEEYERFKDNLKRINEIVTETTNNLFMLILKKMNLRDDELVYKDSYQVVIDRNTYLKHNDNNRFEVFV